jgi:single-strand DNA-binding protein
VCELHRSVRQSAGCSELRHGESGSFAYVAVLVNDRARQQDGSYQDTGAVRYNLTVRGTTAQRLVELAQRSGNLRIMFAGRYRVREFEHAGSVTLSHDVRVDELGVSLVGQTVTVQLGSSAESFEEDPDDI